VILRVLVLLVAGVSLPRSTLPSPIPRDAGATHRQAASDQPPAPESVGIPIELDWIAPPECPDRDAVRAEVLRLVGNAAASTRHLTVHASIRPAEREGFVLSLKTDLDGETGERTLSGVSCQSLSDAAALMLALILNPDIETAPSTPAQDSQTTEQPAEAASSPADRWPVSWHVGAHAGMQSGVLADASPAFAISLGVAVGGLAFRLMPALSLPQDIFRNDQPQLGGRLWTGSMAAFGCWAPRSGRLTLSPCLGIDVTRLRGHGVGAKPPRIGPPPMRRSSWAYVSGMVPYSKSGESARCRSPDPPYTWITSGR
jgi:hypothetical protein